jgi:Phage gp6-like head-tail connector protein
MTSAQTYFTGEAGIYKAFSKVVTPATGNAFQLVDLQTVKDDLGITTTSLDSVLTRYINACSGIIAKFCNRTFPAQSYQDDFFPQRDPAITPVRQGIDPIQLLNWPIIAPITSVVENTVANPITLTSGTDFWEDDKGGQLTRLDTFGYPRIWPAVQITVQYNAGYNPIPLDLADACMDFVKWRYFSRTRDPGLRSQNIPGDYEASYLWGTGPGGPDDIPGTVAEKVERYRIPVTT